VAQVAHIVARAPNGQEPLSPSNSGALAEAAAAIPITPPLESAPLESGPSGTGIRGPDSPRSPLDGTSSSSAADTSTSPAPPRSTSPSGEAPPQQPQQQPQQQQQPTPLEQAAAPSQPPPCGGSSSDGPPALQRPSPFSAPAAQQSGVSEDPQPQQPRQQPRPRPPAAGIKPPAAAPVAVPARQPLVGAVSTNSQVPSALRCGCREMHAGCLCTSQVGGLSSVSCMHECSAHLMVHASHFSANLTPSKTQGPHSCSPSECLEAMLSDEDLNPELLNP
jgi:hypothetical protein